MAWFPSIFNSDVIKKRICRYLLKRYLGQFLEEKLSLDQLSVNIFNGTGSVSNLSFDVKALNELVEKRNLPVEFVDGFVAQISITLPWKNLFKDSIFIEVSGMQLTIRPRQRVDNGESMLESMWCSVASSIQLATECLSEDSTLEDETFEAENVMNGLEQFGLAIESILNRIKIRFKDSTLRLAHLPKECRNGIAAEIRAERIEFCDETSCEDDGENEKLPMFTVKKLHLEGVSFYTDEFPVESQTFSHSVNPDSPNADESEPILFGKLLGAQEIRLKTKKLESVNLGPIFDLEFALGSLMVFISPRQLDLLVDLANSLSTPHMQDSNVKYKKYNDKLLNSQDYKKIEQVLYDNFNMQGCGNSVNSFLNKGWSSPTVDDYADSFLPCDSASMSTSLTSNCTDFQSMASGPTFKTDMQNSYSSNFGMLSDRSRKESSNDFDVETTVFHFRLANLGMIILHENILTFGVDSYTLTPSSVSTMNNLATRFFEEREKLKYNGIDILKTLFINDCYLDHLRLIAGSVSMEGNERGDLYNRSCETTIVMATFELLECLYEPNSQEPVYVELLKFMKNSQTCTIQPYFPLSNEPDLTIYIFQNTKTRPSHTSTVTEVKFSLQQCWSEIDLSLYDRLSSIFCRKVICHIDYPTKGFSTNTPFYEAFENTTLTNKRLNLKVHCPFFVLKFRFPIPDLRPDIDKGRHPWWKRLIRKDILFVNLVRAIFETEFNSEGSFIDYKLVCDRISLLFQEGDSEVPIPFAYSAPKKDNDSSQQNVEFPRLSITFNEWKGIDQMEDNLEKDDPNGLTCSFMETPTQEPTPFKAKRFVYKSNPSGQASSDGEKVILPASKQEMNKFMDDALENSTIKIDVVLPYLHIDFSSKHLVEVLYNRLSSDVSLWQSTVAKQAQSNLNLDADIFPVGLNHKMFSLCKSELLLGDLDFDDDVSDISDQRTIGKYTNQSSLAFKVHVNRGYLNLCPNLKDQSGNIVPDQHGQLQFNLSKANIFSVNNYKGIVQKNYICFQVEEMRLEHQSAVNNSLPQTNINNLKSIIYKSKKGMLHNTVDSQTEDKADMFTAAISTSVDSSRFKHICVACGINGATLRHYVTPSEHSWLTQLMDFFDVVDYPVKGYDSPRPKTELHLSLEDCAVDYRPKYLKSQCVVYFGNFTASSTIIKSKTSSLRFIAEESNLFISDKCFKHDDVNLRRDYISVIDLSLFELSLQLSELSHMPKVELKASSDMFNIRTCADSACALAKLINYYAYNGDIKTNEKEEENKSTEPYLVKVHPACGSSMWDMEGMMESAMRESSNDDDSEKLSDHTGESDEVEVFYFPDEGKTPGSKHAYDWAISSDLDSENEFIFLEKETCTTSGEVAPISHKYVDFPIYIEDNHFNVSKGKTDPLATPKGYPAPVYSYTLSDINVVWHMYGGNDFNDTTVAKKTLSFDIKDDNKVQYNADNNSRMASVAIDGLINDSISIPSPKSNVKRKKGKSGKSKWYVVGGKGRKHDILMQLNCSKVRFQHEIYPEKTSYVSRQVLLIHNLEISDKLKSSEINKFLYQYTSETKPRLTNANMVSIKVIHLRPDIFRRNVTETCMKVSMLPLRLNIDQDSIEFLYDFLYQLSVMDTTEDVSVVGTQGVRRDDVATEPQSTDGPANVTFVDKNIKKSSKARTSSLYIKHFVFSPEVTIRIDYVGKRVNIKHGSMAGIMMGIGQLNCLQIKLKRLSYKHGLLGLDKLLKYVCDEWIQDITKTQFPSLIGGVGPMHALFQLFTGIIDLFWLPIEQYQKDGRIFRGIQRGANSFTTSTVIAALELTARIIQAIQCIAEAAFDMLSPGPSVRRIRGRRSKKKPHRYSHPADIREGVTNAYALVKEGIEETAETLVRVASAEAEQKGAVGAVGGVLRQIPPSMVAPIIIASAATSNLLGGVRNQLAPDSRREASFKWKTNET